MLMAYDCSKGKVLGKKNQQTFRKTPSLSLLCVYFSLKQQ